MALSVASLEGEHHGFPRGRWRQGHFYGVRKLVCAWSDVRSLLQQIDTPGNDSYPYDHGTPYALVREALVEHLGAQTNAPASMTASYERAIVTLYYSTLGPTWYNNTILVDEYIVPVQESHRVNPQRLKWGSSSAIDGVRGLNAYEAPIKTFYSFEWVIFYHRLTAHPAWLQSNVGYTNSNVFFSPSLGLAFAPRTILYKPPKMHRVYSWSGAQCWDAEVRYEFKPVTWHRHWRSDAEDPNTGARTGAFEKCYVVEGAQYKNVPEIEFIFMP